MSRPRSTTTKISVVVMLKAATMIISAIMNSPMRRSRASAVKSGPISFLPIDGAVRALRARR